MGLIGSLPSTLQEAKQQRTAVIQLCLLKAQVQTVKISTEPSGRLPSACKAGHAEVLSALLARGASVRARGPAARMVSTMLPTMVLVHGYSHPGVDRV